MRKVTQTQSKLILGKKSKHLNESTFLSGLRDSTFYILLVGLQISTLPMESNILYIYIWRVTL